MANIVVFVELREGQPTAPALFALREGRRVASALGATVYALVAAGALEPAAIDALAGPLGASGADKVLLCVGPAMAGPPVESVYAGLFALVLEKLRPRLSLWPAGNVGLQLGPALAVRAEAAYFPRAALELSGTPEDPALAVQRWSADLDGTWSLPLTGTDARVVATLPSGRLLPRAAAGETELSLLSPPAGGGAGVELVDDAPDPEAALELAPVLLVAGGAEREKTASDLRAGAAGRAVVLGDPAAAAVADACPAVVVIVGGKPYPAALAHLRVAPDADVVLAGKRVQAPSPQVSAVWSADRGQAVSALGAALGQASPGAPARP